MCPQDPEVAQAFQEISQNPTAITKYQNNPKIQAVINKLSTKFGGTGPFGGMGGANFDGPDASPGDEGASFSGVPPQPDID